MDHCGYCTFFLTSMDVPTELPTFQPSVFAGAQKGSKIPYVLPDAIRRHPAIIAKVLGFKDASEFVNEIKEAIKTFYEENKTRRVRNKPDQGSPVLPVSQTNFDKWSKGDKEEQGAEKRFNDLLNNVYGTRKTDFLDWIWNSVLNTLTDVMQGNEKARRDFLKTPDEK
jgi:hypothetical protein